MGIPLTLSSVPAATPYIQYVSSGGQTVFPYPFPITQDSDLVVVVNGVTQATDAGYTLSGQGNPTGGNVTFTLGQTAGAIVTLFRNISIQRVTQIGQNSGFSSTAFNAEYNNIYLILQQLQESIALSLQIPNTNNPAPATTLSPTNYANKYLAFDANGNPTPAVLTSSGTLTQGVIAELLFPQTPAENTAETVPVNYAKFPSPWKDISRYVSDNTGSVDISAQFANAIAAERNIIIPEGTYLFNGAVSEIICPDGIQITGAGKTRSIIKMGSSSANGVAALRWNAFSTGVHLADFKVLVQNVGKGQTGLRFAECRSADIERLAIFGPGTTGDDTTAILFDGTGTFTGAGTAIKGCYLSNHLYGIKANGVCTDIFVVNNTFYGTTGHATSHGMDIANTCDGTVIQGNSFNIWNRSIYSQGTFVKQIGNRFESATAPFEWVRGGGNARIWGISIGDSFEGGGVPIYPVNDVDLCMVLGGPGFGDLDGMTLDAERGYLRSQRTTIEGDFLTPGFAAGNFTASGSMSWTVGGGNVTSYALAINGHTATLTFKINGSTAGGSASSALRIAIPGGYSCKSGITQQMPCIVQNNNVFGVGMVNAPPNQAYIEIYIDQTGSSNWTLSANTGCSGSFSFQVN